MPTETTASGSGWLERVWYRNRTPPLWLRVFCPLFASLVRIRRALYARGWFKTRELARPVIVVGNITVGGTGKTPLVAWLVRWLEAQGWRPGVVTRGYGGKIRHGPRRVSPDSDPGEVGDEPVLLARRDVTRIVAGPDRVAAGEQLIRESDCDIVIADDGLQHYRLARDLEIAVIDAARGFGNGWLLPAGPLREPRSRLEQVDLIVYHGEKRPGGYSMLLRGDKALPVNPERSDEVRTLGSFAGAAVHAVAGIGNPERFFEFLRSHGVGAVEHAFADHHAFVREDLVFADDKPVLMTEKDAVKCRDYDEGQLWYVPVEAVLDTEFESALRESLRRVRQ